MFQRREKAIQGCLKLNEVKYIYIFVVAVGVPLKLLWNESNKKDIIPVLWIKRKYYMLSWGLLSNKLV